MSRIYELHSHAGEISYADWLEQGIQVPIFDKDGTLSHANRLDLVAEVIEGMRRQRFAEVYSDIAISSNNHDARHVKVFGRIVEEALGVSVYAISRADGFNSKPHPEMGLEIARYFGVSPDRLGMIGDRLFTDVAFGRNVGVGAIALCEKAGEGDARGVATLRRAEAFVVGFDRRRKRAVLPVVQ